MTGRRRFAEVVPDLAIDRALDYAIPEKFAPILRRGMKVQIPLNHKTRTGYVFAIKDRSEHKNVLAIEEVLADSPTLPDDLIDLTLWLTDYYSTSLPKTLKTILPSGIRKEIKTKKQFVITRRKSRKEITEYLVATRARKKAQANVLDVILKTRGAILLSELLEKAKVSRSPVEALIAEKLLAKEDISSDFLNDAQYFLTQPKKLNEDQQSALAKIGKSLESDIFATHLLLGITGSGKTEIYMRAIDLALQRQKGTIVLVPEVALTTQTIERFQSRFKEKIALLHYRLSDGARYREWLRILCQEARIVIGPRSAIFAPVPDLGLIIVDEEHEHSYKKEEEMPCYNARDVAIMRGKLTKSAVILGSATPSIESFYNAQKGKYILSKLSSKAQSTKSLKIKIIDMREELKRNSPIFSGELLNGIKDRYKKGEQTIIFLNRRGYHTLLYCPSCRGPVKCNRCDMALTEHLAENRLSCHLCGFRISPIPSFCPVCKSGQPIKYRGAGTELLEKTLRAIFPEIRTCRLDADTTRHAGKQQTLLKNFATGKADVLIGTQMVTKGHHFPEVTLVGIINADIALNIPDFKSTETTFQLITQVAGRAGRGDLPGTVLIQTFVKENSTIKLAAKQDYEAFFKEEIEARKLFSFPPFSSMVKLAFTGVDRTKTLKTATLYHQKFIATLPREYTIHPVQAAGYAKVKNKFRFQFPVRGPKIFPMIKAFKNIKATTKTPYCVRILCDVNPLSTYF